MPTSCLSAGLLLEATVLPLAAAALLQQPLYPVPLQALSLLPAVRPCLPTQSAMSPLLSFLYLLFLKRALL